MRTIILIINIVLSSFLYGQLSLVHSDKYELYIDNKGNATYIDNNIPDLTFYDSKTIDILSTEHKIIFTLGNYTKITFLKDELVVNNGTIGIRRSLPGIYNVITKYLEYNYGESNLRVR